MPPLTTKESRTLAKAEPGIRCPLDACTSTPNIASTACQRCYRRKKKCNRAIPICDGCSRAGAECVYDGGNAETARLYSILGGMSEENRKLRAKIAVLEAGCSQTETNDNSPATTNGIHVFPYATGGASEERLPSRTAEMISPYVANVISKTSSPTDATTQPAPVTRSSGPNGPTYTTTTCQYTHAERIVRRVFVTPLQIGDNGSLRGKLHEHLGTNHSEDVEDAMVGNGESLNAPNGSCAIWPSKPLAKQLIGFYFDEVNVSYPVFCRDVIEQDLDDLYETVYPSKSVHFYRESPGQDVRIFQLFLMFAIGCGILETRNNRPRTDTGLLCAFALRHISALLRSDAITCISGILLYAIYSFSDFGRTNPCQVIGIAANLLLEYGFHKDDPDISEEERDARRRVFWSVYNMDRCLAFTLVRPVSIPDNIIQTQLPTKLLRSGCMTRTKLFGELFQQIVRARRLQGMVLDQVYINGRRQTDPEAVLLKLRNHIDNFKNTCSKTDKIHPYLELSYNLLIVTLYRPNPMIPATPPGKMTVTRTAAHRLLQLYKQAKTEGSQVENYVTFCHVLCVCLTLVYILLQAEGDFGNFSLLSWRSAALEQLNLAEDVLSSMCSNWPGISRFTCGFEKLAESLKVRLVDGPPCSPQPGWLDLIDNSTKAAAPVPHASGLPTPTHSRTSDTPRSLPNVLDSLSPSGLSFLSGVQGAPAISLTGESMGTNDIDGLTSSITGTGGTGLDVDLEVYARSTFDLSRYLPNAEDPNPTMCNEWTSNNKLTNMEHRPDEGFEPGWAPGIDDLLGNVGLGFPFIPPSVTMNGVLEDTQEPSLSHSG